jgi:glutamine---fructose-6-phosphate transaminase (isomerizing)
MCGIIGYIGCRDAFPILISGLRRLEYRGYDSAGIAVLEHGLTVIKKSGKVEALELACKAHCLTATVGIGHTRWATHGVPSDVNAHPHLSSNKKLAIVHNGIIENYVALKESLMLKGHRFVSETDTEVLIHLIEEVQRRTNFDLAEVVRIALSQVTGAYAILIIDEDSPNRLIAARKGSPLVIGVGQQEYFIASDAAPLIAYTKNMIYLKDNEVASITYDGLNIFNLNNIPQFPYIQELELEIEVLEKGGYEHFMLKEIYEQPRSIYDCMRGRLYPEQGRIALGGIATYDEMLKTIDRIVIISCGTSWHAGLIGEYLIEKYGRIPVEVEYASEFRYREPIIRKNDLVIAISQSGETADTLAAIDLAKEMGGIIFGICNVVGSSVARHTDAGIYTHVGPEVGVASTKAFSGQVTVLTMFALYLAQLRGTMAKEELAKYIRELSLLPNYVDECLKCDTQVRQIAERFKYVSDCIFLGRGSAFPVALEGALKLKEISYIHAEGYPAAEMKHGPIALIDEDMPIVFIATNHSYLEKIVNNIQEVKARKGKVIAVVSDTFTEVKNLADEIIEIPHSGEFLLPILATIPLQLLAYHVALLRGCNVDQPRNLAKSVTVE